MHGKPGMPMLAGLLAAFTLLSAENAHAAVMTFDDLPIQPVDGLTHLGVTFGFQEGGVGSIAALYGFGGPGTLTYVSDPSIEGPTGGVLTMDFAAPTSVLGFGVALSTFGPLTPGFSVELFDDVLTSLGVFPVNTSPLISFSEGQFSYAGPPVARAVVTFDDTSAKGFVLDNLAYDDPIPEPMTGATMLLGLAGLAALARHSRRERP